VRRLTHRLSVDVLSQLLVHRASTAMDDKNGRRVSTAALTDSKEDKRTLKADELVDVHLADDALLAELGYKSEFKVSRGYLWPRL
jgi:hypothetical protein